MRKLFKKTFLVFFYFSIILAIFGAGFFYGKSQVPAVPPQGIINADLGQPISADFSLFWEAWKALEENFVDQTKIDYKKMLFGAISGMTGALKDPYTVYMPPADSKIFKEDVSGQFHGVGMEVGLKNNTLTVIAPLEGSPAEKAGLKAGDKIFKIDDLSTEDMAIDEAVKIIRGEKGTQVVLNIFREGWPDAKDFKIIRDKIEIPSLKWELLASTGEAGGKNKDIAYIRIYHFSETASSAFRKAGMEILNSQAKKIILDLRNNPGGYLEIAQNIAGWFFEKGQVITVEDFGGKESSQEYIAQGPSLLSSYPMVVLINKGSASASEILAGALRDNRDIKLIGEKSFGKGSVQELKDLKEGSLKVTVAKWLTPKGNLIAEVGLEPDVIVELKDEDLEKDKDAQLDKAIEILKEIN